jgi:1-deoxy-D-xylulose-5-phosphate reductoisomerase
MKKIAILGSTGSIGSNALKVIESNPEEYRVLALTAGRNIGLLMKQIFQFQPMVVAVSEDGLADILRDRLRGHSKTEVLAGVEGFIKLAALKDVDIVISAMSGAAGLIPTYAAIEAGKDIALANKETMVMAGPVIMSHAKDRDVTILPIDSEHSAIFQALQGHYREDLKRVILTASGGPFRDVAREKLETTTPEEALKHPNWDMGKKITIDSATLMNKGLEVIEAKWLFDLDIDQIDILIHPESIIHSMVEYRDGSIIAQMGIPDMITPISYALSYPRRMATNLPSLRLEEIGTLTFQKPDMERFKCLALAIKASEIGESMPAVLNGANEVAVESFLQGRLGFLQIPILIEKTMDIHEPFSIHNIDRVLEADRWARKTAEKLLFGLGNFRQEAI